MRLRQERGWQERSLRLYRRSSKTLGDLAGPPEAPADPGVTAHRALRYAAAPYRRALAALAGSAASAALVGLIVTGLYAVFSPSFRARIFPPDLAAGRPWRATSGDLGLPESGLGPSSDGNVFFHTRIEQNPYVEIDLGGQHVVRGLCVENRVDCCRERALPLNVEIWDGGAWRLIAQRRTAFKNWSYDVEPVRTDKVRFLHPGNGYFHLRRIAIYGQ